MNENSKVWNTTRTGFKVHVFQDGIAVCRTKAREGIAPAHTRQTARRWVLDTPGLSFCVDCQYRFDFLLKEAAWMARQVEHCHAEALEMNAQPDTDTKENDPMADETRTFTGPLTPIQIQALKHLSRGLRHSEIGEHYEPARSKEHVSQLLTAARRKMGAQTATEAACMTATAEAYLSAAELIEADRPLDPEGDEVDAHVWHVLDGLALILRERAAALLPK